MLNFCDFIQVYIFTTNHHLNKLIRLTTLNNWAQLVKCFMTLQPNTMYFFLEKMREAFALLKLLKCFRQKILAYLRY